MKNTSLLETNKTTGKQHSLIIMLIMFMAVELTFIFPRLDIVLAPIIAFFLCYLYFVAKEPILASVVLIFGNDALGTLFLGHLSTIYLILVFLLYELTTINKISKRSLVLLFFSTIAALMPSVLGVTTFKMSVITIAYIATLVLLHKRTGGTDEFIEKLTFAIPCIVTLQALHLLITGGVADVDSADRVGLIGIGTGDANFSALILCMGVASALNCKRIALPLRILMIGVMIAALIATLSISGLIALLIVLIASLSMDKKLYKIIFRILIVILVLVLIFSIYISLPSHMRIAGIDSYINRVEEKLVFASEGNLSDATTNRSAIAEKKINYLFKEAHPLHLIFGFNALNIGGAVPHNTYIDILLHFGLLGGIIVIGYMIIRAIKSTKAFRSGDKSGKYICTLKMLFLFFAFTLSIYQGPAFAMLFLTCFLL